MLANVFELDSFTKKESVYLQPKLDGHRAIWDGKEFYSRQHKDIVSVPGILKELQDNFKDFPLDGELYYNSKNGFKKTTSICRRTVNIQDDENVIYFVYDIPVKGKTYQERYELLKCKVHGLKRIQLLETKQIDYDFSKLKSPDEINIFSEDYEGTMLRVPTGMYDFGGRSSGLLKIKKFYDAEGEIVDIQELTKKKKVIVPAGTPGSKRYAGGTYYKDGKETPTGTLGAFIVKTDDGKQFGIGSGFTAKQREDFFDRSYIGKTVTYKYQELSEDGVPRFPVFLRFREDI